MFGKRGQEGVTLGTLLLIILGVVVVVVIILGATGSLNFVFEKIGLAPGQSLEAKTQSCIIAAKSNLRNDYCNEYAKVKIAGQSQYVNCEYPTIKSTTEQEVTPSFTCGGEGNVTLQSYCVQLIKAGKADEDTSVNGARCASLVACRDIVGSNGMQGNIIEKREQCGQGQKKLVKGFTEAGEKACCIA